MTSFKKWSDVKIVDVFDEMGAKIPFPPLLRILIMIVGGWGVVEDGGNMWKTFNEGVKRRVFALQRSDGAFAGSIEPRGEWTGSGRIFSTALGALSLEIYLRYRHVLTK